MLNKEKNILISIDWFLPGTNAGGPVRSIANLVEQLKEFNFYVMTSDTDYCAEEPYSGIKANQWIQHAENVFVYYFSVDQLSKQHIASVISKSKCEIIYVNGVYSKFFSRIPIEIGKVQHLKTIVATRGMLSAHALAIKTMKKRGFLWLQNSSKSYAHVHFHVTNNEERSEVEKRIHKFNSIKVIPNLPRKLSQSKVVQIKKEVGTLQLISLGRIAEEKGTLSGIEALQNVKGNVTLDLYGTIYDNDYWEKCKAAIKKLPHTIEVKYKNMLEADKVLSTIQQYHFMLLPSKGENYGHSIVESFIAYRPVIISKNTPWKNLQDKNIGFDVAENKLSEVIQAAVEMDQETYAQMMDSIQRELDNLIQLNSTKSKYHKLFNA